MKARGIFRRQGDLELWEFTPKGMTLDQLFKEASAETRATPDIFSNASYLAAKAEDGLDQGNAFPAAMANAMDNHPIPDIRAEAPYQLSLMLTWLGSKWKYGDQLRAWVKSQHS